MEELLQILNEIHPDVDFEKETSLFDSGILDSMDIVAIIAEVKDVFDVSITAKDMVPANFNSAAALYALIQKLDEE